MANLSVLEIYRLARRAGFSADNDDAVTATAIALAESGGNPDAHNTNKKTGDNSFGLWQINMIGNSALRGGNSSASPATRSSSIPRRTRALPTVSSRHHPGVRQLDHVQEGTAQTAPRRCQAGRPAGRGTRVR
jgi:hypothetical protein